MTDIPKGERAKYSRLPVYSCSTSTPKRKVKLNLIKALDLSTTLYKFKQQNPVWGSLYNENHLLSPKNTLKFKKNEEGNL